MNALEVNNVKVGDEVGFARFYGFNSSFTGGIATVAKINGHRHITLDNGRVFDKYGAERNATHGSRLYTAAYIQRCKADVEVRHELNKNYNLLLNMLAAKKTGAGNFNGLDVFEKDDVIALIKRL